MREDFGEGDNPEETDNPNMRGGNSWWARASFWLQAWCTDLGVRGRVDGVVGRTVACKVVLGEGVLLGEDVAVPSGTSRPPRTLWTRAPWARTWCAATGAWELVGRGRREDRRGRGCRKDGTRTWCTRASWWARTSRRTRSLDGVVLGLAVSRVTMAWDVVGEDVVGEDVILGAVDAGVVHDEQTVVGEDVILGVRPSCTRS